MTRLQKAYNFRASEILDIPSQEWEDYCIERTLNDMGKTEWSEWEEYADDIAFALLPDEIASSMRINGLVAQLLQDCTWDGFHSDRSQIIRLVHDIANGDSATIVEILAALERMQVAY